MAEKREYAEGFLLKDEGVSGEGAQAGLPQPGLVRHTLITHQVIGGPRTLAQGNVADLARTKRNAAVLSIDTGYIPALAVR